MKSGLFVIALLIVLLTLMTGFATGKGSILKLLLRIFQAAGILSNTSPGRR
ncbi:MAG: hypothetical protein ACXVC1_07770 [Tumebacillaceae bacterium]